MWNLLVVENESIVRVGLRFMLDWESFGIHWKAEASSGEEALKVMDSDTIHIVLTDIRMPGMDGLELARRIREHSTDIQIIILSSYATFSYVRDALRIGSADYLHKPTMDEDEFGTTLRKVVRKLEKANGNIPAPNDADRDEYLLSLLDKFTSPGGARLPDERHFVSGYWLTVFRRRDDALTDSDADNLRFQSIRYLIEEFVNKDWGDSYFTAASAK